MLTELLALLPRMIRQSGDSDEAREQAAFAAWVVAAGSHVRRVTRPLRLERKTLIVAVPDLTWRTQLSQMRGPFLFKLNSLLGNPLVASLEFVVNPSVIVNELQLPQPVQFIAPEQEALPLREQADRIEDPEIRAVYLRAAGKCLERRAR
jgi:Dna[CI] antecedent, DciA